MSCLVSLDRTCTRRTRACRSRPDYWPTSAGLLNWTDEEEVHRVMTYALSGNRLTWNVAVPWPFEKLDQLGSRRYIAQADDTNGAADPAGKRNRWACACTFLFHAEPSRMSATWRRCEHAVWLTLKAQQVGLRMRLPKWQKVLLHALLQDHKQHPLIAWLHGSCTQVSGVTCRS